MGNRGKRKKQEKTGRIKKKHRKTWETRKKPREKRKTWRIKEKHRKTRENRGKLT